jgi:hypothetical protein
MTRMKENILLVGILASFIIIPFLPWQILMLTDLILVRILLLSIFLFAISISPQVGILSLASIAFLFIERNRNKVKYIQGVMQNNVSNSEAVNSINTPETAPIQPEFNKPMESNISFSPNNETGDNTFDPVDKTIDQKQVLETESANGSRFVIKQSFDWVKTDLIQG